MIFKARFEPMPRHLIEELGHYNSAVAHGQTFPAEVRERMAGLQADFDAMTDTGRPADAIVATSMIRAKCPTCGEEGVGGILHRAGCGGSSPENPLIYLGHVEE